MENLDQLRQAIDGRLLLGSPLGPFGNVPLGPVATDSREVAGGDLFWAIRGPNYDGADFVAEAFAGGATGAVVNRPVDVPAGCWALVVEDTQDALDQWAAWTRRRFAGTVIAVSGTVGRSTTRQMIHTLLQHRREGTAPPGDETNRRGLPLNLLAIAPTHDYAVLELHGRRKGEIAAMAELCVPRIGVITKIGDSHLAALGDRQGVVESMAELLAALPSDGHAVLVDDPWLHGVADRCAAPITWIGTSVHCDLVAQGIETSGGHVRFRAVSTANPQRHGDFRVPVWGRHHVTSILAAVAVGRLLGLDFDEMADALAGFCPVGMRCEVLEVRGATIINDAYDTNPTSATAAFDLLRECDSPGRRIAVCGDMADLGERAAALHWRMGREAVAIGRAEMVIACGRFARHVVAGARSVGGGSLRAVPCRSVEDALPHLGQAMLPGDVVLLKGSRMMRMERIVAALGQYPRRRSA